ncbi:hypothetical protein [Lonepinella koalarum]|uniref:Uncharacterized protein n=1 Tax=Lonepinella koalarum TaxID=53417 RepID=A0A4R1KXN6_9PAST|nr:hypothetical protein [Lonepinella koalarum]MDH2927917.1 hypothetical protein [Lonepinella koalarum]TCK70114.1 hypothetical protein EV692_1340 [Lonepinella koalarum]TFJ90291.1 hypothetical protein E0709_02830 [Lonepinella koalarum]
MAKKSYDWVAIKLEFVKSSLSTRDFAEAFDIPYSTFSKKVMREQWENERKQIGSKLEAKSIEKSIENRADELSEFETTTLKAIRIAQSDIIIKISTCEKAGDMKSLTSSLVDLQKVYRLALGASTENQATGTTTDFSQWLESIDNGELGTGRSSA